MKVGEARFRHEHIGSAGVRVANFYRVVASWLVPLAATQDIEEGTTELDFKGSLVDDLDLEMDGHRSECDWNVLQHSHRLILRRVRRFHPHRLVRNDRVVQTFPNVTTHRDDLGTTTEDTLGLHPWSERWVDDTKGKQSVGDRRSVVAAEVDGSGRLWLGLEAASDIVVGFLDVHEIDCYSLTSNQILEMSANIGRSGEWLPSNDVIIAGSRGLQGASMFRPGVLEVDVGPTSREHNRIPPHGSANPPKGIDSVSGTRPFMRKRWASVRAIPSHRNGGQVSHR